LKGRGFSCALRRFSKIYGTAGKHVPPSKFNARQFFRNLLEDQPNLVGPIGTEHHQEPYGDFFRQSDRNFLVNVPGVYRDVNRCSGHSVVFYFSIGELPVNGNTPASILA
jgi:hypothetical protein